jgi:hypothetical protein
MSLDVDAKRGVTPAIWCPTRLSATARDCGDSLYDCATALWASRKSAKGSKSMARIARVVVPGLAPPCHLARQSARAGIVEADGYHVCRQLVSAARRHSSLGLLPDVQSRPSANHAHLA